MQNSLIPSEAGPTKTGRISEGLRAVSGFNQVPPDATHWVPHIRWKREKTTHIGWVNVMQLTRPIWTETIGSGGSILMVDIQSEG